MITNKVGEVLRRHPNEVRAVQHLIAPDFYGIQTATNQNMIRFPSAAVQAENLFSKVPIRVEVPSGEDNSFIPLLRCDQHSEKEPPELITSSP